MKIAALVVGVALLVAGCATRSTNDRYSVPRDAYGRAILQ